MNIEELIANYLDGELSGDAEAELHYRLAVSPEDRKTFREMIALRNIARDQRVLHTPDADMRTALFDRLRREEGMQPAPELLPIRTVVPDYAPSRPAVPAAEGRAEERRRRRRIIPFLIPLLLLVISSGVYYWGFSDRGPGRGEGVIVSTDLEGYKAPQGDVVQGDAGSMRTPPGDRAIKEMTVENGYATANPATKAPVAVAPEAAADRNTVNQGNAAGRMTFSDNTVAKARADSSRSIAYHVESAATWTEAKDLEENSAAKTLKRRSARKSRPELLRSNTAGLKAGDASVSAPPAAEAAGPTDDFKAEGYVTDLGSIRDGSTVTYTSPPSGGSFTNTLSGGSAVDIAGADLGATSNSDVLRSGREPEKKGKVEIGPSWSNALEPAVLNTNMSLTKSSPSLLGPPPDASVPVVRFSQRGSQNDTLSGANVLVNDGALKLDGLSLGEGIVLGNDGPSGNPRGRSFSGTTSEKSLSAASVSIENAPERDQDRAMITAQDGTTTNLDTTAALLALRKPELPEVTIAARNEAAYESVSYADAMSSNPLDPSLRGREGFLFARPRQNFVVDMRYGGLVPEQSLGIGYQAGPHSIQMIGGRSGYRNETQIATSLVRGSGGSFESISTTTRSSNIEYEYWGGVGYGYELNLENWSLGGEISLGIGSKFARAGAGLPVSYKVARNVRIEVVPSFQYARSVDDAPTVVSREAEAPGAEMKKEESSRHEEEIRAGIGAGVIIIIR